MANRSTNQRTDELIRRMLEQHDASPDSVAQLPLTEPQFVLESSSLTNEVELARELERLTSAASPAARLGVDSALAGDQLSNVWSSLGKTLQQLDRDLSSAAAERWLPEIRQRIGLPSPASWSRLLWTTGSVVLVLGIMSLMALVAHQAQLAHQPIELAPNPHVLPNPMPAAESTSTPPFTPDVDWSEAESASAELAATVAMLLQTPSHGECIPRISRETIDLANAINHLHAELLDDF